MDRFFITVNRNGGAALYLIVLFVFTLLFLRSAPLFAQWTNPSGGAGANDTSPPLNDSSDHQEKSGALSIAGLFTGDRAGGGDATLQGGIGVGPDFVSSYLVDISAGDDAHGLRFSDGTIATTSNYNEPLGSKGGLIDRSSSKNLGSDWSAVLMGGIYDRFGSDDQATAHLSVGKRANGDWIVTGHCAGASGNFVLIPGGPAQWLSGSTVYIGAERLDLGDADPNNDELVVYTGDRCLLVYTVFK